MLDMWLQVFFLTPPPPIIHFLDWKYCTRLLTPDHGCLKTMNKCVNIKIACPSVYLHMFSQID